MAAEFVALADLLRAPVACAGVVEASMRDHDDGVVCEPLVDERASDIAAALHDARLFRARLADAFDAAVAHLLRELASDVLARELRLEPCDLAVLVRRVCERAPVVRVRVAAGDVARIDAASFSCARVPVVEDSTLAGGDVIVELAGGALDARLGVRLATVLEAIA